MLTLAKDSVYTAYYNNNNMKNCIIGDHYKSNVNNTKLTVNHNFRHHILQHEERLLLLFVTVNIPIIIATVSS